MYLEIIDNFLTKTYHKNLLELLSGSNFNWKYVGNASDPKAEDKSVADLQSYGLTYDFWDENRGSQPPYGSYIEPMLYQIMDVAKCDSILRARADMVTWSKDEFIALPHVDFLFPNTAAIFYVNDNDGDTILYNVKPKDERFGYDVSKDKDLKIVERVSPTANRLALFDGDYLHTGSSPRKHKNKILINSNYSKNKGVEPLVNLRKK
jgi:hypothetical protein